MPTANVDGIEINYRDTGGDGFPIVLAHGFTGNSRNWALTAPVLRERFRVISPDHRGHGLSGRPDDPEAYKLPLMAADLYGLLTQIGVEKCILVGHSMGGMISQLFILEHPEMVEALVLVDTAAEAADSLSVRYAERQRSVRLA
jgi:pimeloyl-ACP methyl ester carboxylesterase